MRVGKQLGFDGVPEGVEAGGRSLVERFTNDLLSRLVHIPDPDGVPDTDPEFAWRQARNILLHPWQSALQAVEMARTSAGLAEGKKRAGQTLVVAFDQDPVISYRKSLLEHGSTSLKRFNGSHYHLFEDPEAVAPVVAHFLRPPRR